MIQPSPPADPAAPLPVRPGREAVETSGLYLVRTLVVDGDAATRELLVEAVGNRGHHVIAAVSLEEAVALLAHNPPDCLVLKLRQEWAAPLEIFLRTLGGASRHPGPQVLAVVLDDPPPHPAEWLERGVDDIVMGLSRGHELDLRLAVVEKRIAGKRRSEEGRLNTLAQARNFENLFRLAPACVLVVAARDGLVLEASATAGRLLGLPPHEVRDRFVSLLLPGLLGRDDVFQQWDETAGPLRLRDLNHRRQDGTLCELEMEVGRCFWSDRPALWLRLEEVGPARRAEATRLREGRLDATRAVAAGAASTLNDALTAVRGNLDLLAKQNTPRAEAQGLLDNAAAACKRAEETIRTLAGLARSSHVSARRRRADLRSLLSRWISMAALSGQARLEFDLAPELPAVEADEGALREALLALVANAEESMPHGGPLRVAATVRPGTLESPPFVVVEITDAGDGISPEILGRIFDPYFSTRPGHQGLGLTQVSAIITAHEGLLEVESTPGAGTTFRVLLPAADSASLAPASVPPTPTPSSRGRVLVMDDDVGIRVIVEKMLTLQGFEVYTVRDGLETIAAYRRARELGTAFDVVLLDLEVRGGMGGRECIARLRGEFPEVKALLSTGFSDDLILENHREHGFSGVLTKPFNMERLVSTVSRLAEA